MIGRLLLVRSRLLFSSSSSSRIAAVNAKAKSTTNNDISSSSSNTGTISHTSAGGRFYEELRNQQDHFRPHLLMARVGDFYEFYWEQARTVSAALGFKLATVNHGGRQQQLQQPHRQKSHTQTPTVMCGFPAYRLNEYVRQLLGRGFSIAKYEQYDQMQRNKERVIIRRVDRIYTPGTVVEEDIIGEDLVDRDNFLMAIDCRAPSQSAANDNYAIYDNYADNDNYENNHANNHADYDNYADPRSVGFACVDLATGRFYVDNCSRQALPHKLAFIRPTELLISNQMDEQDKLWLSQLWQQSLAGEDLPSSSSSSSFNGPGQRPIEQPDCTFDDLPGLGRNLHRLFHSSSSSGSRSSSSSSSSNNNSGSSSSSSNNNNNNSSSSSKSIINDKILLSRVLDGREPVENITLTLPSRLPKTSLRACSSLINYILQSHSGALPLLNRPQRFDVDVMAIDGETQKSLELLRSSRRGEQSRSLFHYLDETITPFGRRLLSARLRAPSAAVDEIQRRLDIVQLLNDCPQLAEQIRQLLGQHCKHDLMRAVQNLRYNNGGPWHLGCIMAAVRGMERIHRLASMPCYDSVPLIQRLRSLTDGLRQQTPDSLAELISSVLPTDAVISDAATTTEATTIDLQGNSISTASSCWNGNNYMEMLQQLPRHWDRQQVWLRPECNVDLLRAKQAYDRLVDKKSELAEQLKRSLLEAMDSRGGSGGPLSVQFESKKPLGAFVEVETTLAVKQQPPAGFRHLQTLGGSSKFRRYRYRHPGWTELERELSVAFDRYLDIERQVFRYVCEQIYLQRQQLSQCVSIMAEIDVSAALALKACEYQLSRPTITTGTEFLVDSGRHPVVERFLNREAKRFQANDCRMRLKTTAGQMITTGVERDHQQHSLILLTGPNMGGKSTFLRQNAVIAIMAQMGSFVPARHAQIGVVDRIFSRVGSSDDLSRSQSSFMVEMSETAFILQRATERSLIIMDEVGRGTSAEDGKAIAWAVIRYLAGTIGARCLFATHFYDLAERLDSELSAAAARIKCMQTKIIVCKGDATGGRDSVVFTHQIEPGVCLDSQGLHIARMAGVPEKVIQMAERYVVCTHQNMLLYLML